MVTEIPSPPPPPVASTNSIAHTGHRPGSVDGGVHIMGQMYRLSSPPPASVTDSPWPPEKPSAVNHFVRWATPSEKNTRPATTTTVAACTPVRTSHFIPPSLCGAVGLASIGVVVSSATASTGSLSVGASVSTLLTLSSTSALLGSIGSS